MKRLAIVSLVVLLSTVLAACGGAAQQAATAVPAGGTKAAEVAPTEAAVATAVTGKGVDIGASAEAAASKGLTCLADAYNGKMKGAKVSMTGPLSSDDEVKFQQSRKKFEDATGITIEYVGLSAFETMIGIQMAGGTAADIIDFPQPGLLAGFFKQGKVIPVAKFVPESWLKENYKPSWLDMATMTDPNGHPAMSGLWWRFNGKSLVWYPKKAFDAAGYKVPTTWDELLKLDDQIVAKGDTPWCIGIGSGAATGWPATDWTEDMMLRTTSPENYDKWVKGELKFDSPEIKNAIQKFADIWNNDKMVYGGRAAIVSTDYSDAPAPMFQDPPKCWLHRQGNFITTSFPQDAKPGVDYDVFYFPAADPQYGKPFLVAGDIVAATRDRPEVCAVMQYFSTAAGVEGWLASGGALGPQNDVTPEMYGIPLERSIAELASQATTVRFDASDMMPGAVGTGSFWKGMTAYFSGAAGLDTMLKEIDASWPGQVAVVSVAPTVQSTPPPQPTQPRAQLLREKITSQALAGNLLGDPAERTVYVILPPGYETSGKRYPVLYVMPWGDGEPSENATTFYATMNLLPKGEINEMIVVVPDGANKLGASQFRSSPTIGDYETYVSQEVVNYVDTHYRTLPARESRGLAGCSNGGSASMRLGLKYPNVFSVVAATDGSYDDSLEMSPGDVEAVQRLQELPKNVGDLIGDDMVGWYVQAAAGTAPDPNNPPFYSEMPFRIVNGQGEFVPEVIAKIVEDDAAHEARRYVQQPVRLRGILIRHGSLDTVFSPASVHSFEKLLTDLGIDHEYVEEKAGHCGSGWEESSLKYMSDKLAF